MGAATVGSHTVSPYVVHVLRVIPTGRGVGISPVEHRLESVRERGQFVRITIALVHDAAMRESTEGVGDPAMGVAGVGPRSARHGFEELLEGLLFGHRLPSRLRR